MTGAAAQLTRHAALDARLVKAVRGIRLLHLASWPATVQARFLEQWRRGQAALPVLMLGGLESVLGAILGGLAIGILEKLFEIYWGQPLLGGPGEGKLGQVRSGALEDSNVDLTAELVNMMTAQRAYQANAQTIKTQDQVMSTIVNLR